MLCSTKLNNIQKSKFKYLVFAFKIKITCKFLGFFLFNVMSDGPATRNGYLDLMLSVSGISNYIIITFNSLSGTFTDCSLCKIGLWK